MEWYQSIQEWLNAPANRAEIALVFIMIVIIGVRLERQLTAIKEAIDRR